MSEWQEATCEKLLSSSYLLSLCLSAIWRGSELGMSYDYESDDMDSGENGYINFIGGDGDITDGKGANTPKD